MFPNKFYTRTIAWEIWIFRQNLANPYVGQRRAFLKTEILEKYDAKACLDGWKIPEKTEGNSSNKPTAAFTKPSPELRLTTAKFWSVEGASMIQKRFDQYKTDFDQNFVFL